MSAFLPLLHTDSQDAADELDVLNDEASDPGAKEQPPPLEETGSSLLHSSATLLYQEVRQRPSCLGMELEMTALRAVQEPAVEESLGKALPHPRKALPHPRKVGAGRSLTRERRSLTRERRSLSGAPSLEKGAPSLEKGGPSLGQDAPSLEKGAPSPEKDAPSLGQDAPSLEKGAPSPPRLCDPSVHVLPAPGDPLLEDRRGDEEGDGEEGESVWEGEGEEGVSAHPELQPCLGGHWRDSPPPGSRDRDRDEETGSRGSGEGRGRSCCRCSRENLKATAALAAALLVYPLFLYGAYVFLPFDVPLMPDLSARLVYTLRCSVFATVPVIMGIIVYGLARLCSSSLDPFGKRKEEVEIHLRFVTDSIHLFVLFLINLLVVATYLPPELLKLLPLLTAGFSLARLIYWVTFAISSTFRGFGYGLSFFPILGLLVCNLSYMFVLAPDQMFATGTGDWEEETEAAAPRQRFWG
ncbi:transmembrane protein 79-like [Leucoraja erinacea]|uniref:transmembrane protein 79-like n=1 Tax=Leucoraja erinaceus TaxID=7782 RepID=UPI00245735D8|nr:transmembrane protein 79-like [Leucoraja erinacea]